MIIDVEIRNVSQLPSIQCSIDASNGALMCIVGRNGVGKTTLFKALKNITSADTFVKTSPVDIFAADSQISYKINDDSFEFLYDDSAKTLNSKKLFSSEIRSKLFVELPIPHGERFNFFQKIAEADETIKQAVAIESYSRPTELILFLNQIYASDKFDDLRSIKFKGVEYYFRILPNGRYLREDYFSSGEYFLVSLYRSVFIGNKLIVVDEIDISLDAAAQVKLVEWLRKFQTEKNATFVFTTHSLAMMRTLREGELFYMEPNVEGSEIVIKKVSFNYINAILFGFSGWDKYILTEDDTLNGFINHLIGKFCNNNYFTHKIIHIGGATNTTNLLLRNATDGFLSSANNVIAVLDGDQKDKKHAKWNNVFCVPIWNVENVIFSDYLDGKFLIDFEFEKLNFNKELLHDYLRAWRETGKCGIENMSESRFNEFAKIFYQRLISDKKISAQEMFDYLCENNLEALNMFMQDIRQFLMADMSEVFENNSAALALEK